MTQTSSRLHQFAISLLVLAAFVLTEGSHTGNEAIAASKITIVVNNQPITTNDIRRRTALLRLRRVKGGLRKKATDELVDEALKLQEARRIGVLASSREVDAAYAGFAKNNKMSIRNLNGVLNQSGVTVGEFKKFIKAQISWQRAVSVRSRRAGASSSSSTNAQQSWLAPAGQKAADAKEYTLQQIVFTVPSSERSKLLNRRKLEARRFRSQFQGCDSSLGLAKALKNVAVLDRGRILGHKLPPAWRKTIETTPAGKMTAPKVTEKGVEMLAVCKTRNVRSAEAASADFLATPEARAQVSKVEKSYLETIKKRAVIKRR